MPTLHQSAPLATVVVAGGIIAWAAYDEYKMRRDLRYIRKTMRGNDSKWRQTLADIAAMNSPK